MDLLKPTLDERYTRLLNAAARTAKSVTSILDPDLLLHRTVDIICDEFGFRHVGVFLLDETGQQAVLRAAPSLTGVNEYQLAVDGNSAVGAAIRQRKAQVVRDADGEAELEIPCLPAAPSAMALPLEIGDEVIGVLLVQSDEPTAFTPADVTTLQIIADQLAIAINNSRLHRHIQELIYQSVRRARLLETANAVGHGVATILDLDKLLPKTVDIICETYGFYYAGVFLLDDSTETSASSVEPRSRQRLAEAETGKTLTSSAESWAVLRAGRGEAGAAMVAKGYRLPVGDSSMIGAAISQGQARIALDVDKETTFSRNPYLPHTRSEMVLPLIVGDRVLGAVTMQSVEERAFSADDITTLQTMADYLAIAIHNAQVLQELEEANAELVRSKTFEMIATATGEAVHWVGNKAAPIPGSVERLSEDVTRYISMANALLSEAPPDLHEHKFAQMLTDAAQTIAEQGINLRETQAQLERQPLESLRRILSVESIFEDLHIIQAGANAILNIKEDLVGPARKRKFELISLPDLLRETIAAMGVPYDIVHTVFASDLPPVRADRKQLDRVFVNLIKNAIEAMESVEGKKLSIWARPAAEPGMVEIDIGDNGTGIPRDQIDKIWVAFYTTKGGRGGTGLGLSACLEIIRKSGGKIRVDSEAGKGTTFTVSLPAAKD
jgi:GAF domain-containing protein